VSWIAVLVAAFMFLGLRDRRFGGSTHLTALIVVLITLLVVYGGLGR
jgi:heme/copper-type cytochrome/quinol oxidase subunit 4